MSGGLPGGCKGPRGAALSGRSRRRKWRKECWGGGGKVAEGEFLFPNWKVMEKVIWLMPLCVKTARCCRHLGKYFKRLRLQSLVGKAEAAPRGPDSNGAPPNGEVTAGATLLPPSSWTRDPSGNSSPSGRSVFPSPVRFRLGLHQFVDWIRSRLNGAPGTVSRGSLSALNRPWPGISGASERRSLDLGQHCDLVEVGAAVRPF